MMMHMLFAKAADEVAPRARFELATNRLTVDCSTAELSGNSAKREVPIAKALPICQALISGKNRSENIHDFSEVKAVLNEAGTEMQESTGNEEPKRPPLKIFGREIHMPQSRTARVAIGIALIFFGILGFLPILGFWMIPLGLFVLSQEYGWIRRLRRRVSVWWGRRRKEPLP
jgi:Putative transmembrane protein (PGPGW)